MTPAATPVSAATEQQYHDNDDQDQFHGRLLWWRSLQKGNCVPETKFRRDAADE